MTPPNGGSIKCCWSFRFHSARLFPPFLGGYSLDFSVSGIQEDRWEFAIASPLVGRGINTKNLPITIDWQ